jgi:NTE family protein
MNPTTQSTALVLQGGGALGAYQAGVYEALAAAGHKPDWLAGISIGAINAALIAGNAPEHRVEKLRAFWDRVSSRVTLPSLFPAGFMRTWFNEVSASIVAAAGIPGFFEPRMPPATLAVPGTLEAISYYDTAPLHKTLLELVDFDRLNKGSMRLSVGATHVTTGNFVYFDTKTHVIGPEHIMASGALPPAFAPVIISGEPYWDGGLVSNTPLQHVLDHRQTDEAMDIFQVDLFSARGAMPKTMADVAQREKDIRFSSRTRYNTDMSKELQRLRNAAHRLVKKLPKNLQSDSDTKLLAAQGGEAAVAIMHLINRGEAYETQSKDYEFSRQTINDHWAAGRADVERSLAHKRWTDRPKHASGIVTYDLAGDVK